MSCDLEYKKIIHSFRDIDMFKYAAYRTALKMERLQKACKLHLIDLNMITSAFRDCGYKKGGSAMRTEEVEFLLCSLYRTAKRQFGFSEEPSMLSSIFLSFLSDSTKDDACNGLHMNHISIVLAIFSAAKLSDKHKYIFHQMESKHVLSKENLYFLLNVLAKITEALGEKLSFGTKFVPAAVNSCIQFAKGQNISETPFLDWLAHEPQNLVWLSTHYRLSIAEKIEHPVKCNVCKARPIYGLRYKCLSCFSYNLCQQCFLRGFSSQQHQSKHLVQEFCRPATAWEETKNTLLALRNKLVFSGSWKQNFLQFESDSYVSGTSKLTYKPTVFNENAAHTSNCSPTIQELSNIFEKLEEQRQKICLEIAKQDKEYQNIGIWTRLFNSNNRLQKWILLRKEILQNHDNNLQVQLERLKHFLLQLKNVGSGSSSRNENVTDLKFSAIPQKGYLESTPLASSGKNPLLSKPQNLSKFIKLHAELEGLKSFSENASSVEVRSGTLYSIADLEMNYLSCDTSGSHPSAKTDISSNDKEQSQILLGTKADDLSPAFDKHFPHERNQLDFSLFTNKSTSCNNGLCMTSKNSASLSLSAFPNSSCEEKSSVEFVETELQNILEHLESLSPKLMDLQNSLPVGKDRFLFALNEMEEALKKISSSVADDIC